ASGSRRLYTRRAHVMAVLCSCLFHGKPGTPLPQNLVKVVFVSQTVGIDASLGQKAKHRKNVFGDRWIKRPDIGYVPSSTTLDAPPTQQEVGNAPALAGVALRDCNESFQGHFLIRIHMGSS
ncbi:hypothetical protein, partial [Ramlibacter sp.]|uniref:hypothetical protein n=1 Tax=Ramlibacter sp. TaxID=1917967 RepID=UPI0025DD9A3B